MVILRPEQLDGNVVQFLILRRKLDGKLDGNVGPHRRCPTFPSSFSSNFLSNIKNWTTFLSNFSGLKIIILRTNLKNWTDMFVQFSPGWKIGRIFRPISENRKLDEKIGRASRSTVWWTHLQPHERYTHPASYSKWAPSSPAWPYLAQVAQKISMNSLEDNLAISVSWLAEWSRWPSWDLSGHVQARRWLLIRSLEFFSQQCCAATPRTNWTEMFREAGRHERVASAPLTLRGGSG